MYRVIEDHRVILASVNGALRGYAVSHGTGGMDVHFQALVTHRRIAREAQRREGDVVG